jgi:hypothetical protein
MKSQDAINLLANIGLLKSNPKMLENVEESIDYIVDVEGFFDSLVECSRDRKHDVAKILVLLFFSNNPNTFGLHTVFDSIPMHIADVMDDDLRLFVIDIFNRRKSTLDAEALTRWRNAANSWGIAL